MSLLKVFCRILFGDGIVYQQLGWNIANGEKSTHKQGERVDADKGGVFGQIDEQIAVAQHDTECASGQKGKCYAIDRPKGKQTELASPNQQPHHYDRGDN